MKLQNFADIEKWLEKIRPDIQAVKWFFALEDMQKLMHNLGDPQEKVKVIHVAGTSGKTSTCYYIAKMLQLSGKEVGMTVSPHVDSISERVQINGQPLNDKDFLSLFNEFISLPALKNINITYFGMLVAFAYWVFAQKSVDYAVIEVGLGGRLDATNVIKNQNKVCIITDIGLDHTELLGKDLRSIAKEKAGIIGKDNEAFVANQSNDIMDVFNAAATNVQANLHVMPKENISKSPSHLPDFQKHNWSLAKFTFDFIARRDGLHADTSTSSSINIPARMEEFSFNGKVVITDGSHNGQKIAALCKGIKQKYPDQKVAALVSFASGKDTSLAESFAELKPITSSLVITKYSSQQDTVRKPIDPKKIADEASKQGLHNIRVVENPQEAFKVLIDQPEEILLVTGSFFLLNHVRPLLK